jgi:hypothetical protein
VLVYRCLKDGPGTMNWCKQGSWTWKLVIDRRWEGWTVALGWSRGRWICSVDKLGTRWWDGRWLEAVWLRR